MSTEALFNKRKLIEDGDVVVMYNGHTDITKVKVRKGETYSNKVGVFSAETLIGKPYGSKVSADSSYRHQVKKSRRSKGACVTLESVEAITVLEATPELWTRCVDHRTQITFDIDNSLVVSHLHLRPGSVVVESGTGSGSLTMFLARAVSRKGHVYTFEYNAARHQAAVQDFKDLGIDDVVTCVHRNVYSDGFLEELSGRADAVFLDLPNPWLAIPHAMKVLKPFGRICTFSPCIEQVQRTVSMLAENGFSYIVTSECLLKEYRKALYKQYIPDALENKIAGYEDKEDIDEETYFQEPLFNEKMRLAKMPKNCKIPLQVKHRLVETKRLIPFDRMPGHTGYLTFAYAPESD